MSSLAKQLYQSVFKRTSTFVITVVVLAYPFERIFNTVTDKYFRSANRGKLYEDIKKEPAEEE